MRSFRSAADRIEHVLDRAREIVLEAATRSTTECMSSYVRPWGESEFEAVEKARDPLERAMADHAGIPVFAGFPTHRKFRDEPLMHDLIRQMLDGSDSESIP